MASRVPDVVVIGHLTIDRTPRGEALGGLVLYAALTAARYGARTAILTRANLDLLPPDQHEILAAISAEVEIIVQSSDATTTFTNSMSAGAVSSRSMPGRVKSINRSATALARSGGYSSRACRSGDRSPPR